MSADLRQDARACFAAAVRAVEPERLVARFLTDHPQSLETSGRVALAAVGKAAGAMTRGAARVLGDRLTGGVVIAPVEGDSNLPPRIERYAGGHPVPNEGGVRGAAALERLAAGLGAGDLLLCLISGGGSALMTLPPESIGLADLQATTRFLLRAGADIRELNCVRKHLDRLKGGRLARIAAPARVVALVLSDVVGDPLDVIASGPVSPDSSSYADALAILERRGVAEETPPSVRDHLTAGRDGQRSESPSPGDPCFKGVTTHVIGNNRLAADAALAEARRRGYRARLLTTTLTGEAREAGRFLAAIGREMRASGNPLAPPACVLAAGETTVTVRGNGLGGRNQEVALGAAVTLAGVEGVLVASMGTDGIDGPTDAAGAVADGSTVERARARRLDPVQALHDNDAYPFFQGLGDLLFTGPTGTNVMDLTLVLVSD